ncbi:MAG: hypothetical protein MUF64_12520 [Polyangiaceae bacterium]|jgi:hypothetical protein|nr:hypothetical protein [Polyangiaceae bacterium]
MFSTTVAVAGLSVRLRVRGPFDVARFRHRFGPYEVPGVPAPDGELLLYVEPQGKILTTEVPYPGVRCYRTDQGFKMLREGLALWVGVDGRAEAHVRGPEKIPPLSHEEDGGPAETPLRLLVSLLLLRSGRGALFHASGYAEERGGLLFLGLSGAGKTTLALRLPGGGVLSDDQVALLLGPPIALQPTPFVGVLGRTIPPRDAPLRAIVRLDEERQGRITPVPPRERSAVLLACLPLYAQDPLLAARALRLIDALQQAPLLRGSFSAAEGPLPWIDRVFRAASAG